MQILNWWWHLQTEQVHSNDLILILEIEYVKGILVKYKSLMYYKTYFNFHNLFFLVQKSVYLHVSFWR